MSWYVFIRMTPGALQRLDGRQGGACCLQAGGDGRCSRTVRGHGGVGDDSPVQAGGMQGSGCLCERE